MANTATLADVKLVLSAPVHIQTKRSGYGKARVAFVSARTKFMDRAAATTWTDTVEAARRPPQTREGRPDGPARALREVGDA